MAGSRLFDAYLMVDWSAASRPKRGRDSIWAAFRRRGRERVENPSTRMAAFERCRDLLRDCVRRERRVLAGFDFSFAFPVGTGEGMGVQGWRGLWAKLADEIQDGDDNRNNRFDVASRWNQRLSGEAAPFWGCPAHQGSSFLSRKKPRTAALPELRLCERRARARSSWQLFYNGSVGSQTLLGIPWLERLRTGVELGRAVQLWPFETGFQAPSGGLVTLVEVYPSLLPVHPAPLEVKDSAQVRTLAAHFERLDEEGRLAELFGPPSGLTAAELDAARREEGWILGVR